MAEEIKPAVVDDTAKNETLQMDAQAQKEERTFTRDEFNKALSAEKDKVKKQLEEIAEKKFQDIQEAERLKGLSEVDRLKALLEKKDAETQEFQRRELTNQFKVELTEKGLPSEIVSFIDIKNADVAKSAVDFFSKYKDGLIKPFADKVAELEDKLRNATIRSPELPKSPSGIPTDSPRPIKKYY